MSSYLVKALRSEYKRKTLSGKFHFNTVNFFINHGNTAQKDWFEGQSIRVSKDHLKSIMPIDVVNALSTDMRGIHKGYKYIHIISFSLIDMKTVPESPLIMWDMMNEDIISQFGDICLVIKDPEALLRRIINKCNKLGHLVMANKVRYYVDYCDSRAKLQLTGDNYDEVCKEFMKYADKEEKDIFFSKSNIYQNEKEYRIIIATDEKIEDPIDLDVGDIKDIAYIEKIDTTMLKRIVVNINARIVKPFDSTNMYSNSDIDTIKNKAKSYEDGVDFFLYI